MDSGRNEYTFFWFIENYSYSLHTNMQYFTSPNFTICNLEGTTWEIDLYPRGNDTGEESHISLYLGRRMQDDGPESISLNFELSVIAVDGSDTCIEELDHTFKRGGIIGWSRFLKIDEILLRRKSDYLPQDILTVCCKLWKGDGNVCNIGQSSARTRIGVEKNSFLHVVENFSQLQPNAKQTIKTLSHSKKGRFITSSLNFTAKNIMFEIEQSNLIRKLYNCELLLLDRFEHVIECGKIDCHSLLDHSDSQRGTYSLTMSLTREEVLNKKSEYLPDDKLSLICECIFTSGLEFQITEEANEVPLALIKQRSNYIPKRIDCKFAKKLSRYPSGFEDIKTLYSDQCLTDVEVKTETKSFPAHKIVLCARSPVFRAMLTNDMKEKNTDCIHVDDLEDDIVQQLLFFLYSDNIENLQWKNATELYYAADKYQIGKLKIVCSKFLVENLTPAIAGELLLLADTHSDGDLKKSVEDFILKHEEQIFVSKEWDMVAKKNPQLVIKTMQLKYKRKNEVNLLESLRKKGKSLQLIGY